MAELIYEESRVFLHSLLCGFGIWIIYDILLMLRRTFRHGTILMSIEDILFWLISAGIIFSMLYSYNYGSLRGYVFLGILIGVLLHIFCVTRPLLSLYSFFLKKAKQIIHNSIKILSKKQKKD